MKSKVLNALLLLSSLMIYMAWGDRHCFTIQAEAEVLNSLLHAPKSVLHPLTLLPMLGQLLLIITLFQKKPVKGIAYFSIFALGILILLVFLAGFLSLNLKQMASTFPFFILSVLIIRRFRIHAASQSAAADGTNQQD